ncbi:MAG TPA: glycosyltransferase family 9 protein [Thermomicrobiaceae bacterium]|nr:glycosyltransferase family 9 protein [Thermomicrobiaceae bacterium]
MIAHRLRDAAVDALARLPVWSVEPAQGEILLIRPDHLGDVLFLTPALHRLRRALPDAHLTLAIGPWARPAVAENPDIDEILEFPFPGFTRATTVRMAPYWGLAEFIRMVRARRPAAAVVLRDDHWWAALAVRRAGVPVRLGSTHPSVRHMLTNGVALDGHAVEQNGAMLNVAASLLGGQALEPGLDPVADPLRWWGSTGAGEVARVVLADSGVDRPYLVLAPGAGAPVKRWPARYWAEVVSRLAGERDVAVVVVGSNDERPLAESVAAAMALPIVDLTGRTDFATLGAVLGRADIVLGVDSGPLHLATAVGARTVRLYGPSSIERYGPWGDPRRNRVLSAGMRCSQCGDLSLDRPEGAGCMLAIGVDEVLAAAREVLEDA